MNKKQFLKKTKPVQADFVYGVHSVKELLMAKRRKVSMIYTTKVPIKQWPSIQKLLPAYVPVTFVTREALEKMAQSAEHQGIVAITSPFMYEKNMFDPATASFIVVLDGVQDVRNVGAIIRSAYCAGVDGIVLCSKNSALITPAAIKASAGLAEHARIVVVASMTQALQEIKKKGYSLYVATLQEGKSAITIEYTQPAALIIGNEEHGVSKETLAAGQRVLLAQKRADISYNASVAAGILMFLMATKMNKIS